MIRVGTIESSKTAAVRHFAAYTNYKNSGVEWLGDIPKHWDAKRLKDCVTKFETGGTPDSDNTAYWSDETGTPWVSIADMTRSARIRSTARRLTETGLRSKRLPILPKGTLLYSMYASLGKVALLEVDAVVNQAILGLTPCADVDREYLRWWLTFMEGHVTMLAATSTQDNLSAQRVRAMPVFVPPTQEQRAIAAFLDRETAKIDALVAKKEQLIELLQEKKSALITRAVTKGIDPRSRMKQTGVDWLGEVPVNWKCSKMWAVTKPISGGTPKDEPRFWNGDIPWVSPKDMKRSVIDSSEENVSAAAVEEAGLKLIACPAILVVVRGMILAHSFPVAVTGVPVTINQDMKALVVAKVLNPNFFAYWLRGVGRALRALLVEEAAHGTKTIRMHKWRVTTVVVPPKDEQARIVDFLDAEVARFDGLIDRVRDAVSRLAEVRSALVSAAVTGQIDVREEVE